jgi:hypothetical protein
MNPIESRQVEVKLNWMRFLPYALFGLCAFSLTSVAELNYFFRGYLVLLEIQTGILIVYLLMPKIKKITQDEQQ